MGNEEHSSSTLGVYRIEYNILSNKHLWMKAAHALFDILKKTRQVELLFAPSHHNLAHRIWNLSISTPHRLWSLSIKKLKIIIQ
jgi:hypothetical protein